MFIRTLFTAAFCLVSLIITNESKARTPIAVATTVQRDSAIPISTIGAKMNVGDIVFIRVKARPFQEVASATGTWTNHVGIVIDTSGNQPLIGESTFPFSRATSLSRFAARSEDGRIAIARLKEGITHEQQIRIRIAADERAGILYDTGFDLHSNREFCSRYVREVVKQATGIKVGEVETFTTLLKQRPDINLGFWKVWYFGHIPWLRETVTPASLLISPKVRLIYNGNVAANSERLATQTQES